MKFKFLIKKISKMSRLVYNCYILLFILSSCSDFKGKKTKIEIIDNDRHYYPILTGQDLDVVYKFKNTGDVPLLLTDIITSCGCLVVNKITTKNVPPGEEGVISLKFNSSKNIGYAKHYIELYGNFATTDKEELIFDVNVVPNALYTKDYEELHKEAKDKNGNIKDMVDGKENNLGYYLKLN